MSKIFLINHKYKGSVSIFFEDKEQAEKFCELANCLYINENESLHNNFFVVKEVDLYKDFEDYVNNNHSSYEKVLKQSIKNLNDKISEIENGKKITIKLDENYFASMSLKDMREIVINNKMPDKIVAVTQNVSLKMHRNLNQKDTLAISKEYEFSKKHLDKMKKKLEEYKREYLKIVTSKNEEEFNFFTLK